MLDGNLTRANCVDFRTGGKRTNKGFSYLYLINVERVTINLIIAIENRNKSYFAAALQNDVSDFFYFP